MVRIHIVNPTAGQGKSAEICKKYTEDGDIVYETRYAGDVSDSIERFLHEQTGEVRFFVYGGDGSVSEAVNGILRAGAADRAVLTPIPAGTGNDFIRMFADGETKERRIDAISVNGGYAVNMLNAGFDADVAAMISELKQKPFVSGSFAYILGVVKRLCQKMGQPMTVSWTDENGETHTYEDDILLCAVGNARFCGGGFCAAPLASMADGLLDLLIVRRVSRLKFISLVGAYHDGTHIGADGNPTDAFSAVMQYHKCTSMRISGMKLFCRDGEVSDDTEAEITLLPGVLRVMPAPVIS